MSFFLISVFIPLSAKVKHSRRITLFESPDNFLGWCRWDSLKRLQVHVLFVIIRHFQTAGTISLFSRFIVFKPQEMWTVMVLRTTFGGTFSASTSEKVLLQHMRNKSDISVHWLVKLRSQRRQPLFSKTRQLFPEDTKHEPELVMRSLYLLWDLMVFSKRFVRGVNLSPSHNAIRFQFLVTIRFKIVPQFETIPD